MNYNKLYYTLIENRKSTKRSKRDDYYERHHIIPRCLGGSNLADNLILLTPREHYIAHWLLSKMHIGISRAKLSYAFLKMCANNPQQRRQITSTMYERAKRAVHLNCSGVNATNYNKTLWSQEQRRQMSERKRGPLNPAYGKDPWNKGLTANTSPIIRRAAEKLNSRYASGELIRHGTPKSDETKRKISNALSGKPKSDEHKRKLSEINKNKVLSEETRKKMSVARKGRVHTTDLICPHCGHTGRSSAMFRWHFDNCKHRA